MNSPHSNNGRERSSKPVQLTPGEQLDAIATTLYQLVPSLLDILRPLTLTVTNPETIVRSLLLAGAGKAFEPTYAHAMRYYNYAWDAVQYWERIGTKVPEQIRADSLARWRRELRDREDTLRLLEVEILDVPPGSAIDAELHQAHAFDTKATHDPLANSTIAEVRSPAFRWRDDNGNTRVEPAIVVPFVLKDETPRRSSRRFG